MFRGLICAQSAFHMFSPCFSHVFLAQHAARTPHSVAGKPHLSFSNTPAVVDYDQLMGFPYQGGQRTDGPWCFWRWTLPPVPPSSLDISGSHLKKPLAALAALALSLMPWTCRGRTTWSNHVPVSPGSNFVDLRKGHGPSFVSLVVGHVWWRIFQCQRESRINLLYINWRLTQHHWVFTDPKVEKTTSHWHFGWLLSSGKASNSQTSSATSTPVAPLDCQRHHGRAF